MSNIKEIGSSPNAMSTRGGARRTGTDRAEPSVRDGEDLPPNHHAHSPQLGGVLGYLAGLTMLVGRRRDARLVARLAALDSTDDVVDIGCGPGTAVRTAASRGARVTGVDPSRPMLRLARFSSMLRRGGGELRWLEAGAEHLPLPDGSSTVCWSLASVHHWSDLEQGVAEVARVLAPGGLFVALEKRTGAGASGRSSHGWTPAQAERFAALLTTSGFDDVRVADHDLGRRGVVTVVATLPTSAGTTPCPDDRE